MTRPILVRGPQDDDEAQIARVRAAGVETLRQTYRPNLTAVKCKESIAERVETVIAVVGREIVGTVQYYLKQDSLSLMGLSVAYEHRRQGVARALIDYLSGNYSPGNRGKALSPFRDPAPSSFTAGRREFYSTIRDAHQRKGESGLFKVWVHRVSSCVS